MTQLTFDLADLGLRLEPTIAMKAGMQEVYQHSHCGTVVVRSSLASAGDRLGSCPSCTRPNQPWLRQTITASGLAGLRLIEPVDVQHNTTEVH